MRWASLSAVLASPSRPNPSFPLPLRRYSVFSSPALLLAPFAQRPSRHTSRRKMASLRCTRETFLFPRRIFRTLDCCCSRLSLKVFLLNDSPRGCALSSDRNRKIDPVNACIEVIARIYDPLSFSFDESMRRVFATWKDSGSNARDAHFERVI